MTYYIDAVLAMKNKKLIRIGYKTNTREDGSNFKNNIHGKNGSLVKIFYVDIDDEHLTEVLSESIEWQKAYGEQPYSIFTTFTEYFKKVYPRKNNAVKVFRTRLKIVC